MIHSASSSSSLPTRNDAVVTPPASSAAKPTGLPSDQIHIDKAAALRSALQLVPEIRPEVVERARALAADAAYPSDDIIRKISETIVNAPDLSDDAS